MENTGDENILRSKDIPVLRGELGAFQQQVTKRFDSIDRKFDSIDRRFESVDKRFDSVDRKLEFLDKKMDAGFLMLQSEMHKMMALMEQQNSRNIAVIDSHNQVNGRQDRLENEILEIKKEIGLI